MTMVYMMKDKEDVGIQESDVFLPLIGILLFIPYKSIETLDSYWNHDDLSISPKTKLKSSLRKNRLIIIYLLKNM